MSRILFFISAALVFLSLSSCQISRFVYYNFANITDYKIFPYRTLKNDSVKFQFSRAINPKSLSPVIINGTRHEFDDYIRASKTVAFIIIKNDSIQYEKYFDEFSEESIVPSFSMSKSFLSILIGCAIDEGLIKSVEDPVTKYVPELAKNGMDKVTIKHLLTMRSGIKSRDNFLSPFGDAARYYYGRNLRKYLSQIRYESEPGKKFKYLNNNSQLLGLILERALKNKPITEYFQEKIWVPLGMEYEGSWSTDRNEGGMEKTFCCVNARARDFAKIGRLYLHKGNWNGKQIVSEKWVTESTKFDTSDGSKGFYRYQWWIPSRNGDFMAVGMLGQYIYVNPLKNLVIVRMGKDEGNIDWWDYLKEIAASY